MPPRVLAAGLKPCVRGQLRAGIGELGAEVWERVYGDYPNQKCQNGGP